MNTLVLFVATALACFGWPLFDDKPRAAMALAYVLVLVLFGIQKARAAGAMALVCTFGIWANAAGLACVIWYERLSSRIVGVCDEGTGMPVGLIFAVGFLVVAAELLRVNR